MTVGGGMVAAGHPLTAEVGARVLREGGNAVDAAIAAVLASWVCEPLLTGPGAGRLHARRRRRRARRAPGLLRRGAGRGSGARRARGAAAGRDLVRRRRPGLQLRRRILRRCPGARRGSTPRRARWGSVPLADLAAPAAALARDGVPLTAEQAYIFEILDGILCSTPEARAEFAPGGRPLREGEPFRSDELRGDDRAARRRRAPRRSTTATSRPRSSRTSRPRGGQLGAADLAAYAPVEREPVRATYRGREILTNPPPSAGGVLLALAFARLGGAHRRRRRPPSTLVGGDGGRPGAAHDAFTAGLADPGFLDRFLAANLGSTTHVSRPRRRRPRMLGHLHQRRELRRRGPGHRHPPQQHHGRGGPQPRRLLPRAARAAHAVDDGADGRRRRRRARSSSSLGSAGSNRIRSAILQVVVNVVDRQMAAGAAIDAPRLHAEGGRLYAEPGVDVGGARGRRARGRRVPRAEPLLRRRAGRRAGRRDRRRSAAAGDPRRGGSAVAA